jgi:hypothetical protein
LAYVASLEERLRVYESNGVQANIQLQRLAKKLDIENRKLKKILFESCGIGDVDLEREEQVLVEEIKSRFITGERQPIQSPSSTFSSANMETLGGNWTYNPSCTPLSMCFVPSAPLSDVRSQKPPTPPPTKDDVPPANNLLLTLAPQATPNCGEGLSPGGKRFCGLLQLLASETNGMTSNKTVPCRVSYELLKRVIDEQDELALENAAFELKDSVRMGDDGCYLDAKMLTKVLENKLNNGDANERMMMVNI